MYILHVFATKSLLHNNCSDQNKILQNIFEFKRFSSLKRHITVKSSQKLSRKVFKPQQNQIYWIFFSFWNIVWYVEGIAGRTSLTYVLYDAYANIASHAYQILGTNTIIERLFSILHLSH